MAANKLNGPEGIMAGTLTRALHNTTTAGSAVITKVLPGTTITFTSTGADAGTGDVTFDVNASALTVTPTNGVSAKLPDVLAAALAPNSGVDNNAATYGVFGLGIGVVASTDLGLMSSPVTQVSDLGLMSSAVTTTIDLGLFSA